MGCACAKFDPDIGYRCEVSGDSCVFYRPNSKLCAEVYGEGPDAGDIEGAIKEDEE